MDKLIEQLRKYPYSGHDIMEILDKKTKILKYSDLKNFKTIDEVFKPFNCFVLLYETKKNYGHWVCVLKHGKQIEYFDPLGYFIDDIIYNLNTNLKKELHQEEPYLSNLLLNSKYDIIYNKHKIQQSNKDISTCGRHIAMRLVFQDLSLEQYFKLLKNSKLNPDNLVTYMTAFI